MYVTAKWIVFVTLTICFTLPVNAQTKYKSLKSKIESSLDDDTKAALQFIQLYEDWATEDGLDEELAKAHIYRGDYFYSLGDLPRSTELYLKASSLSKSIGTSIADSIAMHSYIYAAYNYNERNIFDKALVVMGEGLPFAKRFGDKSYLADYYSNLGGNYYFQGDLAKAINNFDTCLIYERQLADTTGMVKAINNLGKINMRNDSYQKAIAYYEDALDLQQNSKSPLIPIIYSNLGDAYLLNDQSTKAEELFELALKQNMEKGDSNHIISNLISLSELALSTDLSDKALRYAQKAETYISSTSRPLDRVDIQLAVGKANSRNGSSSSAIRELNNALIIAQQHNLNQKSKTILEQLYKLYEATNKFEKATEINNQLRVVESMISKAESTKAIEKINSRYQFEKQLLEIENLTSKNRINALEIENLNIQRYWFASLLGLVCLGGLFLFRSMKTRNQAKIADREQTIKTQAAEINSIQSKIAQQLDRNSDPKSLVLTLVEVNQYIKTPLTDREYEVLLATYQGLTNQKIADQLFLSINTIKFHLKNIYEKLEVSNRVQALKAISR